MIESKKRKRPNQRIDAYFTKAADGLCENCHSARSQDEIMKRFLPFLLVFGLVVAAGCQTPDLRAHSLRQIEVKVGDNAWSVMSAYGMPRYYGNAWLADSPYNKFPKQYRPRYPTYDVSTDWMTTRCIHPLLEEGSLTWVYITQERTDSTYREGLVVVFTNRIVESVTTGTIMQVSDP